MIPAYKVHALIKDGKSHSNIGTTDVHMILQQVAYREE